LETDTVTRARPNHRIQATAGGLAVLRRRIAGSPAAPDAERYAY